MHHYAHNPNNNAKRHAMALAKGVVKVTILKMETKLHPEGGGGIFTESLIFRQSAAPQRNLSPTAQNRFGVFLPTWTGICNLT